MQVSQAVYIQGSMYIQHMLGVVFSSTCMCVCVRSYTDKHTCVYVLDGACLNVSRNERVAAASGSVVVSTVTPV